MKSGIYAYRYFMSSPKSLFWAEQGVEATIVYFSHEPATTPAQTTEGTINKYINYELNHIRNHP